MESFNRLGSRAEKIRFQNELLALREQAAEILMQIPGVVHVGVGLKESKDELVDTACFRVYVQAKKALEDIPEEERIPAEVLGVPTDVLVMEEARLFAMDTQKYRPLQGGCQIQNAKWKEVPVAGGGVGIATNYGTLGCLAKRTTDNKIVGLSNHHVLTFAGAVVGDSIGQPTSPTSDFACCEGTYIGTIAKLAKTAKVDAGTVLLKDELAYSNSVIDIGFLQGSTLAVLGENVRKRGRTSELTSGKIEDIAYAITVEGHPYTDQIKIKNDVAGQPFAKQGDSGSVIVNADNKVVGLLHAGSGLSGIASHIDDVLNEMDIEIIVSGVNGVAPHAGFAVAERPASEIALDYFRKLTARMESSEGGEERLAVFTALRKEFAALLRDNRAVKAAWSRYQGQGWLSHFAKTLQDFRHEIPETVNGITWQAFLIRMTSVLEEQGSPTMRSYIGMHSSALLNLKPALSSIEAFLEEKALLSPSLTYTPDRHE